MLDFLRRLFEKRPAPYTERKPSQGQPVVPVAPPTEGSAPVIPLETPTPDDERQPPE